jgi:AcrR family transcriptional regulator
MNQTIAIPPEPHAKGWSRRKQARPGEILDAALKVFAEKGFAAARMEDIAQAAGVTKGTIYLYFESKEEVFKSLARATVGPALADFEQRVRHFQGSSRDLLVMLVSAIAAFIRQGDRAALPKIIISESGNFPELARFWHAEVIDKALAMMKTSLRRGMASGEFRPLPEEIIAKLCVAPVILGVIWQTTFAWQALVPMDPQLFLATHIDVLLNGLLTDKSASKGDAP